MTEGSVYYGYKITAESWENWKRDLQCINNARAMLEGNQTRAYSNEEFIQFLEFLLDRILDENDRSVLLFSISDKLAIATTKKSVDRDELLNLLVEATECRKFELEEDVLTFRAAFDQAGAALDQVGAEKQAGESEIRVSFSSEPETDQHTNQTVDARRGQE